MFVLVRMLSYFFYIFQVTCFVQLFFSFLSISLITCISRAKFGQKAYVATEFPVASFTSVERLGAFLYNLLNVKRKCRVKVVGWGKSLSKSNLVNFPATISKIRL